MVLITPTQQEQTQQDSFISQIDDETPLLELQEGVTNRTCNVHDTHSVTLQTPLSTAAGCDRVDVVEYLVSCNARVDDLDNAGYTPLHWTAIYGSLNAAKALLSLGADPTILDPDGRAPHQLAMENNEAEVAEILQNASKKV